MKTTTLTVILLLVSGCASNVHIQERNVVEKVEVVAIQKNVEASTIHEGRPPQIWSDHKALSISASACAEKGMKVLSSLGFIQVVKSKYGAYVYGNHSNNRAAIKCFSVKNQTFVYAIVAGPEVKTVERFRNEIMWQY